MRSRPIRIGTRGSPLALYQANEVQARLADVHGLEPLEIEIRVIKTSGDTIQDKALRDVGGKGLFSKEIEAALIEGDIDLAVHSVKDMETELPEGLVLGAVLQREDVRDAFISPNAKSLGELAEGAVVGTSSLRRQAQIKRLRPDLKIVPFRGNVETRLRKLADGAADATLLAYAGLRRLGLEDRATRVLDPDELLPAAGQGAIGIEVRASDGDAERLIAPLNHTQTGWQIAAERAFLCALDGSCHTPIGALALVAGNELSFRGMILSPDGAQWHDVARQGSAEEAAALGRDAGAELKARAGPDFFDQ